MSTIFINHATAIESRTILSKNWCCKLFSIVQRSLCTCIKTIAHVSHLCLIYWSKAWDVPVYVGQVCVSLFSDACDSLMMMIATSHVQFKCLREGRFFPLGTLCLSSSPPALLDGRTSSKNLISSKSKFQEFERIHHKFCLSCSSCVWVASASIGQTKYTRTQISFHSQMMFLMWYFIQSSDV